MTLERAATGAADSAREQTLLRLRAASGSMAGAALARLDETLPWYRAMGPQERSWVGLVAQAGIAAFTAWYRDPSRPPEVSSVVFGSAPRALTRAVSLHHTLQLVRAVVDVVEDHVSTLAAPGHEAALREAVLRYSREVAFSAASLYARAAEARGAWDARLEALVVDAVVRGEADDALATRVTALGWQGHRQVIVVVGQRPAGDPGHAMAELRRAARSLADDALVGLQGERALVVLGAGDPVGAATAMAPHFGPGPVVLGPQVEGLSAAGRSARTALLGLTAARGWPGAPRPVTAEDLLPERVLAGDTTARRALVDRVHAPLVASAPVLVETLRTYLSSGRALEATARTLFVHPNTVRYRLRRVAEVTGWDPVVPREAFVLQVALVVGALAGRPERGPGRSEPAPSP